MEIKSLSTMPPVDLDKKSIKKETKKITKKIGELQYKMNAQAKYSVLIVLQGMDASGKDGIVKNAFKHVSPNGINTVSYKKPTKEEFAHDFLWRVHKHTPAKGMMTVFNRSHYEDILVPSVYGYIDESIIDKRYETINDFEKSLTNNNTHILKFFLNVSEDEQYKRLMERIDLEQKHWKHNDGDWEVREKRNEFEAVYEKIIKKCTTPEWHVVAADKNWFKTYFVAKKTLELLESLDLKWPELDSEM